VVVIVKYGTVSSVEFGVFGRMDEELNVRMRIEKVK